MSELNFIIPPTRHHKRGVDPYSWNQWIFESNGVCISVINRLSSVNGLFHVSDDVFEAAEFVEGKTQIIHPSLDIEGLNDILRQKFQIETKTPVRFI